MVLPRLNHPIPITISVVDETETTFDEDYREPVQQSERSEFVVQGQIKNFGQEMELDVGGRKVMATGYVLFRYIDLNTVGIVLKYNALITKLGNLDTHVYVIGLTPIGHYSDQGGPTMVRAYYNDRQPATGGFDL